MLNNGNYEQSEFGWLKITIVGYDLGLSEIALVLEVKAIQFCQEKSLCDFKCTR